MTTLTTAPVAPLLERLQAQNASASRAADPALAHVLVGHEQLMRSKTEYRAFYGRLKDFSLAVSPDTGKLLYMLARSCRAPRDRRVRNVVRYFDAAPRGGAARQWWRPADHQRIRTVQAGAGPRQPDHRRTGRSGRVPGGRRLADAQRRSARHDRSGSARRGQGAVCGYPQSGREPAAPGRLHRRRQCRLLPRLPRPRACVGQGRICRCRSPTTSSCRSGSVDTIARRKRGLLTPSPPRSVRSGSR